MGSGKRCAAWGEETRVRREKKSTECSDKLSLPPTPPIRLFISLPQNLMPRPSRLLALAGLAAALVGASTAAPRPPRGVAPADAHLYAAAPFFCPGLAGLLPVPPARINDGYCDCVDGSDEPGASEGVVVVE